MASVMPDLQLPYQPQAITPLISTKLQCLVTAAQVCEQLASGYYLKAEWPELEPVNF